MPLEIKDLPAEVHQLIVCEYFVHPETDAVAIVAVEEAGVGDKSVTGGLESMTGVEDINGEDVAKLHDDFTIGLITCWMF